MNEMTAIEMVLFENLLDANDMIDESRFNLDTNGVIRWAIIADTFSEMF